MKDFYKILGISPNATQNEIKKSYRKQALQHHPDKGGGNEEYMKVLNEAYNILSDPESRRNFDQTRDLFKEESPDEDVIIEERELLNTCGQRYSETYRDKHKAFIQEFSIHPLKERACLRNFSIFKINDFECNDFLPFFQFLESELGSYDPENPPAHVKSILHVSALLKNGKVQGLIIFKMITDITTYAQTFIQLPVDFTTLFQSNEFRNLYAIALLAYWQDNDFCIKSSVSQWNSYTKTKEFKTKLNERYLQTSFDQKSLKKLTQFIKLLEMFEKQMHQFNQVAHSSTEYRENAYRILDWYAVFSRKAPIPIILNIFRQAGIYFQLAAETETVPALQMADEKLAFNMYQITFDIGNHLTPDLELHSLIYGLKNITTFKYADNTIEENIRSYQYKALLLANVFPFFVSPHTNIDLAFNEEKILELMRQHLHTLVALTPYSTAMSDSLVADYKATVLYRAYEASLKHWYEIPHNAQTENAIRLKLMETLLADKGWDFVDVEDNVAFDQTTINRNLQSWIEPSSMITETQRDLTDIFSSVNELEVNIKTGQIKIRVNPCNQKTPDCFRTITLDDVIEIIRLNIKYAYFSLDPVDPTMPYHPFNKMRFFPTRLYNSSFLQTMLSADYLLKFLTVNQEVQGVFPFDFRPLDSLIQFLPEYLRKILFDFHQAQQDESIHRFWIETKSVPYFCDTSSLDENNILNFHFYDVNMAVRKHLMRRDEEGNLIDDDKEIHEGWYLYLFNVELKRLFDTKSIEIQQPAIVFFWQGSQILFVNNNQHDSFILASLDDQLERLRQHKHDEKGRIIENVNSEYFLYALTRQVTTQANKPSYMTAEHIFACEFTAHYDEFALYFPELKRLQEFNRLIAMVHILGSIRKGTKKKIKKINEYLKKIQQWQANKESDVKELTTEIRERIFQDILEKLEIWREDTSYKENLSIAKAQLSKIREKVGNIEFNRNSAEVKKICKKRYEESIRYTTLPRSQIRAIIYNESNREKIARELSKESLTQLAQEFKKFSSIITENIIQDYLKNNNIDPLAAIIADSNIAKKKNELAKQLNASLSEVEKALNGSATAIHSIVDRVMEMHLPEYLEKTRQELLEQRTENEKVLEEFQSLGLGINKQEIDLLGLCLWVPANVKNTISIANNRARFVYGGVLINPALARSNQMLSSQNFRTIGAQQLGAGRGSSDGGSGGSRGGGFGGSGGGSGGPGTFDRRAITRGFQDHHIISNKNPLTANHPLIQKAGFDLNSRANRIFLPTNESRHPTRSIHVGRHLNEVSKGIADQMNRINKIGESQGWSTQQYNTALRNMLTQERASLKAGDIVLNKHMRPWAK